MRKAMIVWGGWPGHDPDLCASLIRGWLKQEGFDVRIETTTAAFADPAIHDLSLIIPIYTMSKIEKPEALNLCAAVRSGVGLAGHHGGMCDAFRDSVEYQFLCGGQWVAHPGNIIDYKVDLMKPDDPIMQGLKSFEHRSEQYYMHVDPANEVLATTTFTGEHAPWIEDVVMPVVWKKRYGEGRVFYSSRGRRFAGDSRPRGQPARGGAREDHRARGSCRRQARLPRRCRGGAACAQPELPLRVHPADRQQQLHGEPDRAGSAQRGLARQPAGLHRCRSRRRVRSGCAGGRAGAVVTGLSRRCDGRA